MTTILSEPIPITSTNLRPFTNKDVTNDVAYKHGLPRPLKHYRLGIINAVTIDPSSSDAKYLKTNMNRYVRSSQTTPLMSLIMGRPGHVSESISNANYASDLAKDERMNGLLTDCCQAKKALTLLRGANTKLDKKYYQTAQQYRYARCNTIQQKSFNYTNGGNGNYVSNCQNSNCNTVIYKPNNAQFSTQGAVSSSLRTSRLVLNTIKTEINITTNNYVNIGGFNVNPFILKAKTSVNNSICSPATNKCD